MYYSSKNNIVITNDGFFYKIKEYNTIHNSFSEIKKSKSRRIFSILFFKSRRIFQKS